MHLVQAPHPYAAIRARWTVFLSGSISMGAAEPWQDEVAQTLSDLDLLVLNPRRDDWDNSWQQSLSDARFVEQVRWELDGLTNADAVLMHFDPATQSPITLLELGLMVNKLLWVSCPDGFWRKGNVDVVCQYYAIPMYPDLHTMVHAFRTHLEERGL